MRIRNFILYDCKCSAVCNHPAISALYSEVIFAAETDQELKDLVMIRFSFRRNWILQVFLGLKKMTLLQQLFHFAELSFLLHNAELSFLLLDPPLMVGNSNSVSWIIGRLPYIHTLKCQIFSIFKRRKYDVEQSEEWKENKASK